MQQPVCCSLTTISAQQQYTSCLAQMCCCVLCVLCAAGQGTLRSMAASLPPGSHIVPACSQQRTGACSSRAGDCTRHCWCHLHLFMQSVLASAAFCHGLHQHLHDQDPTCMLALLSITHDYVSSVRWPAPQGTVPEHVGLWCWPAAAGSAGRRAGKQGSQGALTQRGHWQPLLVSHL
jgi:hypothetical protein